LLARAAALISWLLVAPVHAQQCAGFADVSASDLFCPNIEWIKNRAITLGCGPGIYCPADPVFRNQMAAFMSRLGAALTPANVRVNSHSGAVSLTASAVVCAMSTDIAPATYPRTVISEFYLTGLASNPLGVAATLVSSSDGGASWIDVPAVVPMRNETSTVGWMQIVSEGSLDLPVGTGIRFAARLARTGGGLGDFSDSWCQLAVRVVNRNSPTSPF